MPNLNDLPVGPKDFLGLGFPGSDVSNYPVVSQGGMGVVRLSISWKLHEPTQGNYNWTGLNSRVAALRAEGITPFLTFEADNPLFTDSGSHGITNQMPLDMDHWLQFVALAVQETQADYYQVANEWDSANAPGGGWGGTDAELIDFVTQTAATIRANSPAKIVMGGITSGSLDILVLNKGLADYEICSRDSLLDPFVCRPASEFQTPEVDAEIAARAAVLTAIEPVVDILDLHLYGPAERDPVRIAAIRLLWTKPILSAECGGPSMHYENYTPEAHFMAVLEHNLNMLSENLQFGLWFRLGEAVDGPFGNSRTALFENDGTQKPGYHAYKMLAHVLDGATGITRDGTKYTVSHPAGDRVIAWGGVSFIPPPGELWRITNRETGAYGVWNISQGWPFQIVADLVTVAGL